MMFVSLKPSVMSMNQIKLFAPDCRSPCVNLLGCKLSQIELEVHQMKQALGQVHMERRQLEHQRKALEGIPEMKCIAECVSSQDLKVQELQEKYDRLEEDFKSKVLEVCALRCELEKQKTAAQAQRDMQLMLEKAAHKSSHKLDMSEQELQLNMARQRFREAQDELEELRLTSQDQVYQLDDYRTKYLQAQQEVEEMRSKIEVMEMDNAHVGDKINSEIQKAKLQFKEKIRELAPLPSILKATQIKLQEYQKGKLMTEHKLDESNQELEEAKQQIVALEHKVQLLELQEADSEVEKMTEQVNALENKCNDLTEQLNKLNASAASNMKALEKSEKQLEQKTQEVAQVAAHLETVREESARQVARAKDRAENIRRCLQSQITDLELQLAQSRAIASAAQKDRDEIRQRMQYQINNLSENFDQAQMRIRTLHSQVNFLKRSYSNIFAPNPLVMIT